MLDVLEIEDSRANHGHDHAHERGWDDLEALGGERTPAPDDDDGKQPDLTRSEVEIPRNNGVANGPGMATRFWMPVPIGFPSSITWNWAAKIRMPMPASIP